MWRKVVNKNSKQNLCTKNCKQEFSKRVVTNSGEYKVIRYAQKLWLKDVNMSCDYKFWIKVVNESCEQKLWTKVMNKMYEQKFWTQFVNKIQKTNVVKTNCQQKLWKKM